MKRIGILGDIGSGKSYVAKSFGYPVFSADAEVSNIYKKEEKIFKKLNKVLPKYFQTFPINKKEIIRAILANKRNLRKITKIIHFYIRKKMHIFLKKNKRQKFVILDIPLLLENKINKKNDVLIYVQSNKSDVLVRLKKRKNFNIKLYNHFKNIQLPLDLKKKKSDFIIKNNFTKNSVRKSIKKILNKIL